MASLMVQPAYKIKPSLGLCSLLLSSGVSTGPGKHKPRRSSAMCTKGRACCRWAESSSCLPRRHSHPLPWENRKQDLLICWGWGGGGVVSLLVSLTLCFPVPFSSGFLGGIQATPSAAGLPQICARWEGSWDGKGAMLGGDCRRHRTDFLRPEPGAGQREENGARKEQWGGTCPSSRRTSASGHGAFPTPDPCSR